MKRAEGPSRASFRSGQRLPETPPLAPNPLEHQFRAPASNGRNPARIESQRGKPFQNATVLDQDSAVGNGYGLVKTKDGVVPKSAEGPALRFAKQGERAIFYQDHAPFFTQRRKLLHGLRPSEEVDHEKRSRISRLAQPHEGIEIWFQTTIDRIKNHGCPGGSDGPYFIAAMVRGHQDHATLTKIQGSEQVIDRVPGPIEVCGVRCV